MADVRINEVTSDIAITDASSLLSPQLLERITQAVLARLRDQDRLQKESDEERRLGREV